MIAIKKLKFALKRRFFLFSYHKYEYLHILQTEKKGVHKSAKLPF